MKIKHHVPTSFRSKESKRR